MSRSARVLLPLSVISVASLFASGSITSAVAAAATPAPPGPGVVSHFDLARKDCLGTARTTTSKIWYTVAGGVLSDVYAPTVDTTNVESMQFIVSDGRSFTDLQTRDMTYTVSADSTGMACTVTSTAKSGRYRLVTTYLTDPQRDSVVVHTAYQPVTAAAQTYRLFVRLDATVAGNGGGGTGNGGPDSAVIDRSTGSPVPVSYDTNTATNAINRDYAVPTFLALRAQPAFDGASSGFVGTPSDGLAQLDTARALSPKYGSAANGNVVQTARMQLDPGGEVTLALGFGITQTTALSTAGATLARPLAAMTDQYIQQWRGYDQQLSAPAAHLTGLTPAQDAAAQHAYYVSANVVKASEDKTFPGAIVASLASPWGQAVSAGDPNNTYFGSYREVFARDLYEAWTALLTDGDLATARDTVRFLFLRQQLPDGSMPRNSLVNGKAAPDTFNIQLDEVAYPILMARQSDIGADPQLWPHIMAAADYLIAHGPSAGPERWEEQSGYSPSTIAAEIAGLVAAGKIARDRGEFAIARVWEATADRYQRSIKGWTLTTNGPLSASPYFIRLSKNGDPNEAVVYNTGNGGSDLDQRAIIDAGFLELVRLGELSPFDADVRRSLKVVDATIKRTTPSGPGWLRYNGDGYGDCYLADPLTTCSPDSQDGSPWAPENKGTGHVWPVLTSERSEHELATGDAAQAASLVLAMMAMSSGVGLVPEQAWDSADVAASPFGTDPTIASIGMVNGKPDGSAAPLTWGAASLTRLIADLTAGTVLEKPADTTKRYVRRSQREAPLTVTSPVDRSTPVAGVVHVAGSTARGATVDIARVGVDQNSATTVRTLVAGADGSFAVDLPAVPGIDVFVVTATSPAGATAQTTRTVADDVVAGTLLFDASDPTGDDNGPGNYAYPTDPAFHPGAFDIEDYQVYDTGSTVTFRLRTGDQSPTFGSPLGAQLIDVYVHQPGAAPTSTAASFPQRNYTIAPADAWSRLLEVQGFGQRYINATGSTVGTIDIKANDISRYITFTVDKASLGGTPAPGWAFTVTLTSQDGFSPDQARGFQPTPQGFQLGVCATVSTDAHCTVDPATVPKVMDTLTPAGVDQSDELDYTLHPAVVLQGVTIH